MRVSSTPHYDLFWASLLGTALSGEALGREGKVTDASLTVRRLGLRRQASHFLLKQKLYNLPCLSLLAYIKMESHTVPFTGLLARSTLGFNPNAA